MKKITLLFALLACLGVQAQWTSDTAVNTLVTDLISDDVKSIGTSDGRTFIVFWKTVAAPVNYELRVQLLDADGMQQFGPNGILISDAIPMSTFTYVWKLSIDKNNNIYVGVTGSGAGNPGYVFKINPAGESLWANGLNLGAALLPTVLPQSNGEVMIAYWPGSGKTKLQKYAADGVAVWANPVEVAGASLTSGTIPADLFEMPNGDITIVFHQKFTFGVSSNLYVQRFDSFGIQAWEIPTKIADKGTAYNAFYSGTQDGDVIYYGFSGSTVSRFDSYVQRINPDGTIPWGINGIDFDTNTTNYEMDTKIAFEAGSDYVWAIARYTPSTQDIYGEYVQKFDKVTGARQFTDNAKEVYEMTSDSQAHIGDLFLQDDAPLFLLKSGFDSGVSPTTLSGVLLDNSGTQVWTVPAQVATFAANKARVTLNKPTGGKAVVVFVEEKIAGEKKIYAQNFTSALLGVDNFETNTANAKIYPNPTNGIFNISSKVNISAVMVYDLRGQLIFENNPVNTLQLTVDATNWSGGVYLISVKTQNGAQQTMKFMKTK